MITEHELYQELTGTGTWNCRISTQNQQEIDGYIHNSQHVAKLDNVLFRMQTPNEFQVPVLLIQISSDDMQTVMYQIAGNFVEVSQDRLRFVGPLLKIVTLPDEDDPAGDVSEIVTNNVMVSVFLTPNFQK